MTALKLATVAQKPVIGLMSGTSLDGIDGVLVELPPRPLRALGTSRIDLPAGLRQELLALNQAGPDELRRSALAGVQLAHLYARVVTQLLADAHLRADQVSAIGCHGQTVRHQPADGYSLQLVNGALLAELTGITTITDFRSRDVAAGGQGAPLVPAFHAAAFAHAEHARAIVNIGGFSNITVLAADGAVRGHDCGPGNALLDAWISHHQREPYDRDGRWARSGMLLPDLLKAMLSHPFFQQAPPRSTGREAFHLDWIRSLPGVASARREDVQRTLLELTVSAIVREVQLHAGDVDEVFICGGGAENRMLMERLRQALSPRRVAGTGELGIGEQQVEAFAFAWLANQTLHHLPGNLPSVTGAEGPRVLGAIYPA